MAIKEKIWTTSKARMKAELRFKRYDQYANILIILYSFTLICISIARYSNKDVALGNFDQVILSFGVFTLSVVVYFADFRGKAASFRECYLRLDKLNNIEATEPEKTASYHEVLHSYPNHDELDYYRLIAGNLFSRGENIKDSNGDPIILTWRKKFSHFFRDKLVFAGFIFFSIFPFFLLHSLFWSTTS